MLNIVTDYLSYYFIVITLILQCQNCMATVAPDVAKQFQ
jgi:hypothetical protein